MQSNRNTTNEFHQSMNEIAEILAQGYMRIEKSRRLDPAAGNPAVDMTLNEGSRLFTPETS